MSQGGYLATTLGNFGELDRKRGNLTDKRLPLPLSHLGEIRLNNKNFFLLLSMTKTPRLKFKDTHQTSDEKFVIEAPAVPTHILYHLILRQCSQDDYSQRKKQHTDLGAFFVASFFENSDSETPTPHCHCIIRLPRCKKTYEDHFRKKYEERNLQVIKQIKPPTLDPTHLENTLLYVSKDGCKIEDDGSINWDAYVRRRQIPKKDSKSKPTFNEYLVDEFKKELETNPHMYRKPTFSPDYEPRFVETQTLRWIKTYFTGKYKDFDEMILLRKYHFLNSMFGLGGIDSVELALARLER